MKFSTFLNSLLPGFEKDRVLEDVRLTQTELREATLPAYEVSLTAFKGYTFKAKEVETFFKTFKRMVSTSTRDPIEAIFEGLKQADENLVKVGELIEQTYNEEVAVGGLTYKKANLLQFVECCSFVSKYARRLLLYVYAYEAAQYDDNGLKVTESLTPRDVTWIEENAVNFGMAFGAITNQRQKVIKLLEDIPDIVITQDNEDTLVRTQGNKIDPMAMRLIPIWLNPIYHVRMFVAEWQAGRYKAAKEELKAIQLRKLHLERMVAGKPDAKIEKEIEYLEGRIQGLNHKLEKIEQGN